MANDAQAYKALSELKAVGTDTVNQAFVVERSLSGVLNVKDGNQNNVGSATLGGGAIGMLLGILGGPIGVLLGFSTGALFGSIVDMEDDIDDTTVLGTLSQRLRPGQTGLIVDINENEIALADKIASASGGVLVRFNYDEVEAEIASAEAAADAAAREASRVLKEQKKAEKKAERDAKWEKTKEKFKSLF